jgi:hypothetical protein
MDTSLAKSGLAAVRKNAGMKFQVLSFLSSKLMERYHVESGCRAGEFRR